MATTRDARATVRGRRPLRPRVLDRLAAALVYVEWRCGPTCGHTLGASLTAAADGTWRLGEIILLSSRRTM
jgi:hypothetical protein